MPPPPITVTLEREESYGLLSRLGWRPYRAGEVPAVPLWVFNSIFAAVAVALIAAGALAAFHSAWWVCGYLAAVELSRQRTADAELVKIDLRPPSLWALFFAAGFGAHSAIAVGRLAIGLESALLLAAFAIAGAFAVGMCWTVFCVFVHANAISRLRWRQADGRWETMWLGTCIDESSVSLCRDSDGRLCLYLPHELRQEAYAIELEESANALKSTTGVLAFGARPRLRHLGTPQPL